MLFLLPPSEGKKSGGIAGNAEFSRETDLPLAIALSASEKDLKCTGKRYAEARELNKNIAQCPVFPAIYRYDGVMYSAINYQGMSPKGQHFAILSGLYGFIRPQDKIANYKLPVNTQLKYFWKERLTTHLNSIEYEVIVDFLPGAYHDMIDRDKIKAHTVKVERLKPDGKKLAHGVKKIKGEWIHQLCKQ